MPSKHDPLKRNDSFAMKSSYRFALTNRILVYALPIVALAGTVLPVIVGAGYLSYLALYLSVPMLASPLIYLWFRKKPSEIAQFRSRVFPICLFAFLAVFLTSIILLRSLEVRPIAYYMLVAVMATLIMFETFAGTESRRKSAIILSQIVLMSLNILWGVTLKYYYFIGRTDVIAHASLVDNIVSEGFVTESFGVYEPFALWHIEIASLFEVMGDIIPVNRVMFIANGLIYGVLLILSYLIGSRVLRSERLALMTPLFVALNMDFISYGMYSISRSVGSFLEIMLIFLLLRNSDRRMGVIAIALSFVMIAYHTASMPFIVMILVLLGAARVIYATGRETRLVTPSYLLIIVVIAGGYWIFNADILLETIIDIFVNVSSSGIPSGIATEPIFSSPSAELFNYLQYSPLLVFIIIGALWTLRSDSSPDIGKLFCLLGLLFVSVALPGMSFVSDKFIGDLNLARFGEYTFLFISISAAAGFVWTYGKALRRGRMIRAALVALFVLMAFLAVSNDFTASDNPLVKRTFYTFYLSEEEIVSFGVVAGMAEGYLMSDYVTTRYLMSSPYESKSHILEVDGQAGTFLRSSNQDIILIREHELTQRPLRLFSTDDGDFAMNPSWGTSLDYYDNNIQLWNSLNGLNCVFDSGGLTAHL